jgi:hypothetical protein
VGEKGWQDGGRGQSSGYVDVALLRKKLPKQKGSADPGRPGVGGKLGLAVQAMTNLQPSSYSYTHYINSKTKKRAW